MDSAFCDMESDQDWLVGATYPSEKYESQLGMVIPNIYGKIKNVPKHQSEKGSPFLSELSSNGLQ